MRLKAFFHGNGGGGSGASGRVSATGTLLRDYMKSQGKAACDRAERASREYEAEYQRCDGKVAPNDIWAKVRREQRGQEDA